MKSNAFGLELGGNHLKAVWLSTDEAGIGLVSCVVLPAPAHGMASESVLDQEEMAETIKQMMAEGKITAKSAHIALTDNQVFTKVIEMPVLSDKELASAIRWEAEQYIPAALSTMTLDSMILKEIQTANGPRMLVLLVAAPTTLVEKYQRVLGMAGVSIASIETEILSAVRAAIPDVSAPTSFIMNISGLSTSFAIVQQGTIIFTYSIPVGGAAVDRAIASDFGFTIAQAEEYKKTYGIAGDSLSGKVGKAMSPVLGSIVSETKKALAFYKDKYHGEFPIEQLLLSGSTAGVPGITTYFADQCGVETRVLNPFELYEIKNIPKEIQENASEFGTVVGLALKEYE